MDLGSGAYHDHGRFQWTLPDNTTLGIFGFGVICPEMVAPSIGCFMMFPLQMVFSPYDTIVDTVI